MLERAPLYAANPNVVHGTWRSLIRSGSIGLVNTTFRYVVAGLVLGGLAGCGTSQARDRAAEIAAAKCFLPVAERIHPADTLQVQTSDTEVKALGNGRFEVTGTATVVEGPMSTYTCDVVPDPSDKLRGLRVTKLRVVPSN